MTNKALDALDEIEAMIDGAAIILGIHGGDNSKFKLIRAALATAPDDQFCQQTNQPKRECWCEKCMGQIPTEPTMEDASPPVTPILNSGMLPKNKAGDGASSAGAPKCFGSNPSYQSQAENDCHTCPYNNECLKRQPSGDEVEWAIQTLLDADFIKPEKRKALKILIATALTYAENNPPNLRTASDEEPDKYHRHHEIHEGNCVTCYAAQGTPAPEVVTVFTREEAAAFCSDEKAIDFIQYDCSNGIKIIGE